MLEKIVGKGFCLIEHQGVQGDAGSLIGFYLQRLPVCVPQKKVKLLLIGIRPFMALVAFRGTLGVSVVRLLPPSLLVSEFPD